jgi:hypothetical protein
MLSEIADMFKLWFHFSRSAMTREERAAPAAREAEAKVKNGAGQPTACGPTPLPAAAVGGSPNYDPAQPPLVKPCPLPGRGREGKEAAIAHRKHRPDGGKKLDEGRLVENDTAQGRYGGGENGAVKDTRKAKILATLTDLGLCGC